MFQKTIHSFANAVKGLRTTWTEEFNFRLEVLGMFVIFFFMYFFQFTFIESLFCIMAITIVLTAEIINTAIEDLCNKVQPEYDPVIGKIKDTTSAFVLVSAVGALIVGVFVFYSHFQ